MKKLLPILIFCLFCLNCEQGWIKDIIVPPVVGCTDSNSCNYNSDAEEDDGNCIAKQGCNEWCEGDSFEVGSLDNCGTCDADVSNDCVQDCHGIWGGIAVVEDPFGDCCVSIPEGWCDCVVTRRPDVCGDCEGEIQDIQLCPPCDDGSIRDCAGVCGGDAVDSDGDGICDSDETTQTDCAGVVGGSATTDNCGTCDADVSNDCTQDCHGIWGGPAVEDSCGVCDSDTSNDNTPLTGTCDCNSTPDGTATIDNCNICVGGTTTLTACTQDCAGVWGGSAVCSIYDVDGNGYSIIIIGTQDWFQQNLKTTKYNNGDEITNETFDGLWNQLSIGAWCNYDNDESNTTTYGRLYNFYTLYDERGICPEGSRVPTDEDWKILEIYLGMDESIADGESWRGSIEGGKLKAVNNWDGDNEGATNESGFTAIPAGTRSGHGGDFHGLGREAYFWASTYLDSIWLKNMRGLSTEKSSIRRDGGGVNDGNSIRCIIEKDCAGVVEGMAKIDVCGNCVEGTTGLVDGDTDSDGICNNLQGTVDDIHGNTYKTIKIGTQTWMAENLKTTKYKDDTAIPTGHSNSDWGNLSTGAYAVYDDNNSSNADTYGNLYNWYAVENQQLCMDGWHVPTDAEWTILTDYLGGEDVAGGKMKEAGLEHWNYSDEITEEATNESGFTGLPAGYRYDYNGTYNNMGNSGSFWSSSENSISSALYRRLYYSDSNVYRNLYSKQAGFSIRCLGD